MEAPIVTFNDVDRTDRIDEILGKFIISDYDAARRAILEHEYCNVILSLLDEYAEIEDKSMDDVVRFSEMLIKLDSPIILIGR